jgi:hypothetical protein
MLQISLDLVNGDPVNGTMLPSDQPWNLTTGKLYLGRDWQPWKSGKDAKQRQKSCACNLGSGVNSNLGSGEGW